MRKFKRVPGAILVGTEMVSAKTRYIYAGYGDDIRYIGWVVRLACRNWHTMGRSYQSLAEAKRALVEAYESANG